MTQTTHECPAPSCEEQLPFERLACRPHWFQIPVELRRQLVWEYQHNVASLNGGTA